MSFKFHNLKILQSNFEDVISSRMSFQLRKDDRCYRVGDTLALEEIDSDGCYTGRVQVAKVNHILKEDAGIRSGFVLLNIQKLALSTRGGVRLKTRLIPYKGHRGENSES